MTIDQVVSLVSSIATFIATILVLFTLFEMKKQRKNSMSPDLYFSNKRIYLYRKIEKGLPYYFWAGREIDDVNDIDYRFSVKFETNNIGMGSAKEIKVNWDYDIENIIEKIKELNENKLYKIEYSNKKDNQVLTIKRSSSMSIFEINNDLYNSYEFILSSQIKNEAFNMCLPSSYLDLLAICIHLQTEKDFDEVIHMSDNFPKMKMQISYKDIGGSIYKNTYTAKIHFFSYTQNKNEDDEIKEVAWGYIEFGR